MSWRIFADFAKRRPITLQLADRLGRGKGRLRFFDRINPPPTVRRPDIADWKTRELGACWLGHATVLLRVGGMTVLTDPVMSNRVGVGLGLMTGGPRRMVAAALDVKHLPPIDLILISHAHFDHLDRPTLRRLPKDVPVITAHRTRDLIVDLGFRSVTELYWGEHRTVGSLKITAQQVQHWGARTFYDKHRGFNAYLIEAEKHRVLYGGDTAYCEYFKGIGKVDLAIMGISAYDPYIAAHATPEQALEMADHVEADYVLPMHHSTFKLSYEPMDEPIQRMMTAANGDKNRVIIRRVGGCWTKPR